MEITESPKNRRIDKRTRTELSSAERRVCVLDDRLWESFEATLEHPAEFKPELERLLPEPGRLD